MAYTVTFCIPCSIIRRAPELPRQGGALFRGRLQDLPRPGVDHIIVLHLGSFKLYLVPAAAVLVLKVDVDVKCLSREHPCVVQRCAERRVCADIERVVPPDEISAYGRADYEQNYENDKRCFQSLFMLIPP